MVLRDIRVPTRAAGRPRVIKSKMPSFFRDTDSPPHSHRMRLFLSYAPDWCVTPTHPDPPRVSIDGLHQDSHNSLAVRTSIQPTLWPAQVSPSVQHLVSLTRLMVSSANSLWQMLRVCHHSISTCITLIELRPVCSFRKRLSF